MQEKMKMTLQIDKYLGLRQQQNSITFLKKNISIP